MPKVKAKVIASKIIDGMMLAKIRLDGRMPKKGEIVNVKWGATRSLQQNALYWVFLTWCIEYGGLKDQGHFSPEALHLDLKKYFLSEKIFDKGKFKAIEEATTTMLDKVLFGEYIDKVNMFMIDFFQCNTNEFWKEYEKNHGKNH